jgi:hypothetical protein
MQGALEKGVLSEAQARQLRASYGGKLSMIDHWLGRVLEAMDRHNLWDDTLIVICTDHGHYLGEKDIWGKPGVPVYQPLAHIPLLIHYPGLEPRDVPALTTAVDLHATLADLFEVAVEHRTHGHSLLPVLRGETERVRDWLLTGVWGRDVQLVTGRHKYVRSPVPANAPLSMLSNRWSTMPTHVLSRDQALPPPDGRAFLDRMPGSDIPVIHQIWQAGDPAPFWSRMKPGGHRLYDLERDPGETENLAGSPLEQEFAGQMQMALQALGAPATQYERLGFSPHLAAN